MKKIEDFLPFVLPFCRGASDLAAMVEIRNAAIDFCARTKCWQERLPAVGVRAGKREISLQLGDGQQVVEIMDVFYRGVPLTPADEDALRSAGVRPDDTGTPQFYAAPRFDEIELTPIPNATLSSALQVRVAIAPTHEATEVADPLFTRFARDIGNGAVARLHMYDEDWCDRAKAAVHSGLYEVEVARMTTKVAKSNVRAHRSVKAHWF